MKLVYPVVISETEDYLVCIPDWEIMTEGKDLYDAIFMARDAISLMATVYEDEGRIYPSISSYEEALDKAKAEDAIFADGIVTLIDIDTKKYREEVLSNRE